MADVPSKGTSSLVVDPEPVHTGSKRDEGSEASRLSRSRRTKVLTVVMDEALPRESQKDKPLEVILCQPQCLLRLFLQAPFQVRE